jgi:hypothetical protein
MQRRLLLRAQLRLLLRLLFGDVPTDDAAAHRADHRMMSCVVSSDATDHRALEAAGGVRVTDGGECQNGAQEGKADATCFHVSITRV